MEMMKKIGKRIGQVIVLLLIFQLAYKGTFSLGTALAAKPDQSVLNIGVSDMASKSLFNNSDDRYWYPGFSEESELRLMNSRSRTVTVEGFGMNLGLAYSNSGEETAGAFIPKEVEDEYLNKMRIQMHYSDPNSDSRELLYSGSFREFMNDGYDGRNIRIGSGAVEDVVYTIAMDEDSSQSIANISASIEFTFRVAEDEASRNGNGGGNRATTPSTPDEFAIIEDEGTPLGIFNKLFMGYPDGSMDVNRTMNRAELACVIYRALNLQPVTEWEIVFSDPTDYWYVNEAKAVVGAGYMKLQLDDSKPAGEMTEFELSDQSYFNGDRIVTRQDLANILTNVFKAQLMSKMEGMSFTEYNQIYTALMNESATISADMLRQIMLQTPDTTGDFAAQVETQRVLFKTEETKIAMQMPVTRLEVAKLFYRLLYLNAPQQDQNVNEESSDL